MTLRERVLAALRQERADRTPRDFWAEPPPMRRLLRRGTPDEVASTVRGYCEIPGRDGGCILGPAHFFQPDVPPGIILAVYRA